MSDRQQPENISSGVDALISRLREEGVAAGQSEAEKIVTAAEAKAKKIVQKAEAKAQKTVEQASKEADALKTAGEDALKVAMRDTVLDMKSRLMQRFRGDVKRLVSHHLEDEELCKQMVLEVAGRVAGQANMGAKEPLDVILPETVVGLEELRQQPDELEHGKLTKFVLGLTGEMLRQGVTFSASGDPQTGIRIHLVDKEITLDLTDAAVAGLLLEHLQPRFRAILEGVVK